MRAVVGQPPPAPFGAYLLHPEDPSAEIARHIEREVFLEAFDNDAAELAAEYGRYEATSVFFVVIDHGRSLPVGMMRLVANQQDGPGLKSWNDLERYWGAPAAELLERASLSLEPERTWDIATLAVAKEYQNPLGASLISLGLYQSVVRSCSALGIEHLIAVLDSLVYRMTRARYAEPFISYAEARPYLGSKASYPVYCTLAEWEERLALTDPDLHSIIYEGLGLEAALHPLDPAELATMVAIGPQRTRR